MFYYRSLIFVVLVIANHALSAKPPEMSYVVETMVIKPVDKLAIERRYIGTIHAEKFSRLSPKSIGTVASIDVKPGQRVKKGQLLISLKSGVEKRSLELAEKSLQSLQKELERNKTLFASQDITKPELEKSEREVLSARARLEEQKRGLENVEIRAPFDGVVGVPRVVLGESVEPGTNIISVMEGPYSVFINIPASRLSEIKVGQPVRMKSNQSTIDAVEMSIDPITRVGFAKALFNTCESCIVGDSIFVHITVYDKPNAILLPKKAIYYQNGKPHVVMVVKKAENSQAAIREVTVGEEQDGQVEILSGLVASEEVVIANPKRIPEGAKVMVLK
jgi:membrane fusion protein, multidrug efflux system